MLTSCGGDTWSDKQKDVPRVGNQLNLAMREKYQTLDPIQVSDVPSFTITNQIYECLLQFDKDLSIKPMIAENWDVSEDGLAYIFKIKKGIYFHDNNCFSEGKGRELKASDVLYSFKRICSKKVGNYAYSLFKNNIRGSKAFHDSEEPIDKKELEGVEVLDDYTVIFKLNHISSTFLESLAILSSAIVAKEAIEKEAIVGTGPFLYSSETNNEEGIILHKNLNYHIKDAEGNKLPYLSAVSYKYISSGSGHLSAFIDGKLDIIDDIPPTKISKFVEQEISSFQKKPHKYIFNRNERLTTSFLSLNTTVKPFNNKKIRQAIALAIDKNKIANNILHAKTYGPAKHGIVPPFMEGYNFSSVLGLEYDVDKARQLLAEAGYKNGKGFPTIVYTTNGRNRTSLRLALNLQKQLFNNLNINLEISSITLAESMQMSKYAKGHIFLKGWAADYPDPANFLSLVYGGSLPQSIDDPSFPNASRYNNNKFNQLYEKILITLDEKEKNELCLMADQIIANDVPIIPLWYHENYGLSRSTVKNYIPNSMGIMYLTHVKIEKDV